MAVTYAQAACTADTNLTSASYTDVTGCSFSLAAGTWLVEAQVSIFDPNSADTFYAKIYNSTDAVDYSSQLCTLRSSVFSNPMPLKAIFTIAGTKTIKIAARRNSNNGVAQQNSGAGLLTTNMTAIQLA